jgi:hypothetical protein
MTTSAPDSESSNTPKGIAERFTKVCGKEITEQMILDDIAAGAPVNPDGTLNLIHYGAWLNKVYDE